jgi:hypothetical protein
MTMTPTQPSAEQEFDNWPMIQVLKKAQDFNPAQFKVVKAVVKNLCEERESQAYAKGKADMAKEMIEQVPKYELNLSQTPTIKALYGGWNSCVDRLISHCQLEQVSGAGEFDNADVSLCASCHCVTHTIDGTCGKCQQPKTLNQVSK